MVDGEVTELVGPKSLEVVPLGEGALEGAPHDEIDQFRARFQAFQQDITATNTVLARNIKKVDAMQRALSKATKPTNDLLNKLHQAREELLDIKKEMSGDPVKGEIGERSDPTPQDGAFIGLVALNTTYGPTPNHKAALGRAENQLQDLKSDLKAVQERLSALESDLKDAGAPWIEGQGLIE